MPPKKKATAKDTVADRRGVKRTLECSDEKPAPKRAKQSAGTIAVEVKPNVPVPIAPEIVPVPVPQPIPVGTQQPKKPTAKARGKRALPLALENVPAVPVATCVSTSLLPESKPLPTASAICTAPARQQAGVTRQNLLDQVVHEHLGVAEVPPTHRVVTDVGCSEDSFQQLLITQRRHRLPAEYCRQEGFSIAIHQDLLFNLCACLFLQPEVYSTAAYLLYKWHHKIHHSRKNLGDMNLLCSGLLLAVCKLTMTHPPNADSIVTCFKAYTKEDVLRAECEVLQDLNFELLVITPVEVLFSLFNVTGWVKQDTKLLAIAFAVTSYRNPLCLQYTPYILARACLLTAQGIETQETAACLGGTAHNVRRIMTLDLSPACDDLRTAVLDTKLFDQKSIRRFARLTRVTHSRILSGVVKLQRIYKGDSGMSDAEEVGEESANENDSDSSDSSDEDSE